MLETASPAARVESKKATSVLHRLGRRHDPQPHLGGDPERPLRADEGAEQVVARRVELLAAERDQLAVGQDDLQPAHVVRGEAVLEAVRAAGVLGHVAADGAHDLGARVGRVEEVRADRGATRRCWSRPARRTRAGSRRSTSQDPLEPRGDDEDAVLDGQRAAGQARAGAARHPRHAGVRAGPHARLDLRGGAGQHRRAGGGRSTAAARRTRRCAAGAPARSTSARRRSRAGGRRACASAAGDAAARGCSATAVGPSGVAARRPSMRAPLIGGRRGRT